MKLRLSRNATFSTHIIFTTKEQTRGIADFAGEAGDLEVRYEGKKTIIYCGLGEKALLNTRIIRSSSARGIRKAVELKRDSVSLILPSVKIPASESGTAAVEGAILGAYSFCRYKSEKAHSIKTVEVIGDLSASSLKQTEAICKGVNYARDLVNSNASEITPEKLAKEALSLSQPGKLKVTVLNEKELKQKGLNLIYAVGQGSPFPPRLILMEYKGNPKSKFKTANAGKGITFDSGGQNLKPTGHIEAMRMDMAGAATVLATMKVLSELKPAVNVIGVIGAAHNAIGENAFFPGDIYKSYLGKTVEINSTDAEGRLVLADAVAYCNETCKPDRLVDLATLTGGILFALGELVAGLFSNDDKLADLLFKCGEHTGERLWRFPMYKEYCDSIKGDLSDLRNLSKFKKGYASSITGAAFIKEFIGDTPWAHIDIAGTAFNEGQARGEIPQYGTGFGVRLLMEFLLRS